MLYKFVFNIAVNIAVDIRNRLIILNKIEYSKFFIAEFKDPILHSKEISNIDQRIMTRERRPF